MGIQRKMRRAAKAQDRRADQAEPFPGANAFMGEMVSHMQRAAGEICLGLVADGDSARRDPDRPLTWMLGNGTDDATVWVETEEEAIDGVLVKTLRLCVAIPGAQRPLETFQDSEGTLGHPDDFEAHNAL